jgi:hypothetical protein
MVSHKTEAIGRRYDADLHAAADKLAAIAGTGTTTGTVAQVEGR